MEFVFADVVRELGLPKGRFGLLLLGHQLVSRDLGHVDLDFVELLHTSCCMVSIPVQIPRGMQRATHGTTWLWARSARGYRTKQWTRAKLVVHCLLRECAA